MKRVIIESPYAGDIERNVRYARLCMLDCLQRGEAPFASHLLYTQVWDDSDDELRAAGIAAGHAWYDGADAAVVYGDLGRSSGMDAGINAAVDRDLPIHYRTLPLELADRICDQVEAFPKEEMLQKKLIELRERVNQFALALTDTGLKRVFSRERRRLICELRDEFNWTFRAIAALFKISTGRASEIYNYVPSTRYLNQRAE